MQPIQGEDMLKTLLLMTLVAMLAACGSDPSREDGEADGSPDVETDGTVPDGTPDMPNPDVTPDMPCYCGNAIHEPECDEQCDDRATAATRSTSRSATSSATTATTRAATTASPARWPCAATA